MTLTRTLVVVASTRPHETDPPAPALTVMITTTMTTTPTSLALDTMANVNRPDFTIMTLGL